VFFSLSFLLAANQCHQLFNLLAISLSSHVHWPVLGGCRKWVFLLTKVIPKQSCPLPLEDFSFAMLMFSCFLIGNSMNWPPTVIPLWEIFRSSTRDKTLNCLPLILLLAMHMWHGTTLKPSCSKIFSQFPTKQQLWNRHSTKCLEND